MNQDQKSDRLANIEKILKEIKNDKNDVSKEWLLGTGIAIMMFSLQFVSIKQNVLTAVILFLLGYFCVVMPSIRRLFIPRAKGHNGD